MNITRRKIGIMGIISTLALMIPISIISFTSITGTNTLTVNEPLKLVTASITGGTCTTSTLLFTCTSSLFAGDSGTMSITIANQGGVPIVVRLTSTSNNTDLVIVNPADTTLPQAQSTALLFTYTLSQSAVPDTVTMTFQISR